MDKENNTVDQLFFTYIDRLKVQDEVAQLAKEIQRKNQEIRDFNIVIDDLLTNLEWQQNDLIRYKTYLY